MLNFLQPGDEVIFQGLMDITLIVEEINDAKGNAHCKYYDEHLRKFIRLTLPTDALVPHRKDLKKKKVPVSRIMSSKVA